MAEAKPAPARKSAAANTAHTDPTFIEPGDNPNAGTAENPPSASDTLPEGTPVDPTSGPQGAPSPFAEGGRTGYHCGYCGEMIGAENQHYNVDGTERMAEHPGALVMADGGPQNKNDIEADNEPDTKDDETK